MDRVTLSLPAAAAALNYELPQHYQTRNVTEMTLLSPRRTYSPLEQNNNIKGLLNKSAPAHCFFFHLVFVSFLPLFCSSTLTINK